MFDQIKIRQLDRRYKEKILLSEIEIPRNGWIREIRTALKMTYKQLSKRLSMTPSAIMKFENNEVRGTINLNSMEKIAEALNCKFVYAIVPNDSLENIIDLQVENFAEKMIKRVSHSMLLESQSVSDKEIKEKVNELKRSLKDKLSSKIWNDEI